MSLLSNRLENFLLSIINWTRSSFVENKFFHFSSPIWYLTKSLKTLNELNLVSLNSGQYSNIWNISSSCCLHNLQVGSSLYWLNLCMFVCNRQVPVRILAFTIALSHCWGVWWQWCFQKNSLEETSLSGSLRQIDRGVGFTQDTNNC